MQRVLQRTARAKRVVAKKIERRKKVIEKDKEWYIGQRRLHYEEAHRQSVRSAHEVRRQDWEMGPLTPQRAIGKDAHAYGTHNTYFVAPAPRLKKDVKNMDHVREGDRVVVIRGPQRGRIDLVEEKDEESSGVKLKDTGHVDVAMPDWMRLSHDEDAVEKGILKTHRFSISHPIEDVRLVYPLEDPKTGVARDVIIQNVELITDESTKTTHRVLPGTNTIIPWPEEGEPEPMEEYELDTRARDVEEETFTQVPLLAVPMPSTVIDELRNKYSVLRDRHDRDFIERKEALDAKRQARAGLIDKMKTPLQELNELRAAQRAAKQKELTPDQLAKIGEVMAQGRAEGAGDAKPASTS